MSPRTTRYGSLLRVALAFWLTVTATPAGAQYPNPGPAVHEESPRAAGPFVNLPALDYKAAKPSAASP